MDKATTIKLNITFFSIFFSLLSLSCSNVNSLSEEPNATTPNLTKLKLINPFTPKASLIRYWKNHISKNTPLPPFLLSKASPLSPVESSFFAELVSRDSLSSHLAAFCSSGNLLCPLDSKPVLEKRNADDANFTSYTNKAFPNYGNARLGGADSFKSYSEGINFASGSFARYSRAATGHRESFAAYSGDANVAANNFTSYAVGAGGGSGDFKSYAPRVNVPDNEFASYDSNADGHRLTFTSYADDTNSGKQSFAGYGKSGNSAPVGFASYGSSSNVVGSIFSGYGESGNAANDSFKSYTTNANNPNNNFKSYGAGGNGGLDGFASYRDLANAGSDAFQSYGKGSSSEKTSFSNYGKSFNGGSDTFKEYAKGSVGQLVGFKIYSASTTFKEYAKRNGVTFAQYTKPGENPSKIVRKTGSLAVEQGKFFRESLLKQGTVTRMPNITDRMPRRSFLPPGIESKLPFSTNRLPEMRQAFQARAGSAEARVLENAVAECEREPSQGETKRCVGSAERMIDFAVSVLGRDAAVRTTEGVGGSGGDVAIGRVEGIDGGRVTRSVSCHQSLYPYLLYYCHEVPKVRVYEVDIHDVESKVKINRGVAICHLDTSAWSPGHGAFLALGSGPGKIEVCHWIFENDMAWTKAD
ncbi:Probable polygalacturonase non-catalytic subunit JP630 [Striga hermonthica]|uniref:Probable polygalacturonase non-catalytic subunit JP630 n=1 Tax=Striga hermonthica TaxID=68872 RepID=A0A9N7RG70_STRHE|nr:Probable polygalacturonase non-catalytic subunit JP630 [Striga hermonthica]